MTRPTLEEGNERGNGCNGARNVKVRHEYRSSEERRVCEPIPGGRGRLNFPRGEEKVRARSATCFKEDRVSKTGYLFIFF